MIIPVLVINLQRAPERRAAMSARLAAADIFYSFVAAIDGRAMAVDEITAASPANKLLFPRPLTPNEVACCLSHLKAIKDGLRLDTDYFCVLEDDVTISPGLVSYLDPEKLSALPSFDALRLYSDMNRWDKPSRIVHQSERHIVVRMLRPGWGMQGQIYSRAGAHKILAALPPLSGPIDFALYHDCHVRNLRVLEVRPGLVECDHSESTIGTTPPIVWGHTLQARIRRNFYRIKRKAAAIRTFVSSWGAKSIFAFLPFWR